MAAAPVVVEVAKPSVVLEHKIAIYSKRLEACAAKRKLLVAQLTTAESAIKSCKDSAPSGGDGEAAEKDGECARSRDRAAEIHKKKLEELEEKRATIVLGITGCDEMKEAFEPRVAKFRATAETLNSEGAEMDALLEKEDEFNSDTE